MPERRGGLSIFDSMLRRPGAQISDEDYELVMANLRESEDERRLTEKMGTGKYWTDTIKHLPASFLARMKQINPETGEIRWLGRAPEPDLDLVGKGLMTLDEWKEEKTAAEEYNEASGEFRSTWIDDTKSMAALPAVIGNVLGGDFETPEFAVEAAQRVGDVQRATQEDFGLEDPTGIPQHLFSAAGAMGAQAPVPGGPLSGALSRVAGRVPQAVRTLAKPVTVPAGALTEFINPTINPSVRNYLSGTVAGGALDTALEPSSADLRDIEERQIKFAKTAGDVTTLITEQWDESPMDLKVQIMYTPFAGSAWKSMSTEQREEMLKELEKRGAFDDAE